MHPADPLIEGVGQEMKPCGPPPPGSTPIQAKGGQWSFRFNYEERNKLRMLVEVAFVSPFPIPTEFCSEMNESEVETLKDWLCRVLDVMNGKAAGR
jgi:hypothetical protein